jgi:transcriptional regulator with XRE-family HTH domain
MTVNSARRQKDPRTEAVGLRIREARDKKGLSQHALALHLGITAGAVGQWELGYALPTMHHFDELPAILDVSREWLLTGKDASEAIKAQTKSEETILRLSRSLSGDQQATLIAMLHGLASPSGAKRAN